MSSVLRTPSATRRALAALALSAIAVLAAAVAAIGPAERHRSVYAWPPSTLPSETPAAAWYTPLLLVARTPERLEVTLPCEPGPVLPEAGTSPLLLATARNPELVDGLAIGRTSGVLTVDVGRRRIATVPLPEASEPGCRIEFRVEGERWSLRDASGFRRSGALVTMPEVTGLFSEVDLRAGPGPEVSLTTRSHGTSHTTRQWLAAVIAVLAIGVALLALAAPRAPTRRLLAGLRPRLRIDDGIVVGLFAVWWILAPTPFDDGWVKAREDAYGYLGEFSNYFDHFGVSLPLGFWLEWVQRIAVSASDHIVVGRIPSLLVLVAGWFTCRATLAAAVGERADTTRARVVLVSAYATFTLVWGMTLRPEPFVALLLGLSLLAGVRFRARPSIGPLVAWVPLIALGVTTHPAGIATAAPVFAVAPTLLRWVRDRGRAAATQLGAAVLSVSALSLTLLTLDSDLAARRASAQEFRGGGAHAFGPTAEPDRYWAELTSSPSGERMFVGVLLLTAVAFLLRVRTPRTPVPDVAARSLIASMLLLSLTPSKWSWHFGILVLVGAVAVAVETLRLSDAAPTRRNVVRAAAGMGALAVIVWATWRERETVSVFDVRVEGLRLRFEDWVSLTVLGIVLLAVVAAAVAFRRARRGLRDRRSSLLAALPYVVAAAIAPVSAFLVDRIAEDALFAVDGWTLPDQNLDVLLGRGTCGLPGDAVVPDQRSFSVLRPLGSGGSPVSALATPPDRPGVSIDPEVFVPAATLPTTSWYRLDDRRLAGIFVGGFAANEDRPLRVEWAALRQDGPVVVGTGRVELPARPSFQDPRVGTRYVRWRFVAQGELPRRPEEATLVRFTASVRGISLSEPVGYRTQPALAVSNGTQLPVANLVVLFPCARLPSIAGGVHEVPTTLVFRFAAGYPSTQATGTAFGLFELYELHNLPLSDSPETLRGVQIWIVDTEIPGTALAPAERVDGADA